MYRIDQAPVKDICMKYQAPVKDICMKYQAPVKDICMKITIGPDEGHLYERPSS